MFSSCILLDRSHAEVGSKLLRSISLLVLSLLILLVTACGGGGGGSGVGPVYPTGQVQPPSSGDPDSQSVPPPTDAPAGLQLSYGAKRYDFRWDAVIGATHYELLEDPDGTGQAPAVPIGGRIEKTAFSYAVPLHLRVNASYAVRACNESGCGTATAALVPDLVQAIGYFKASNTDKGDGFGYSLALSGDGRTLAVGAPWERSAARGIDGDAADNSAPYSGAVYVFAFRDGRWSQQAYVKASNTDAYDYFGFDVSLSADGNTLAVGAMGEGSKATGVNGDQADNSRGRSGATYVFTRSTGGSWMQQAYLKASNTDSGDEFGRRVSISGDARLLAVSAPGEASSAKGIGGDQASNSAVGSGAVYLFVREAVGSWAQQAYIKASNTVESDDFGQSIALSTDGSTLAVGADQEASVATGIGGDQSDRRASAAGAVYVFAKVDSNWQQQAYVKASNTGAYDQFGISVALSSDGSTLAVGAYNEYGGTSGVNGNQADDSVPGAGAAYVFTRSGQTWSQQAYVKASNTGVNDFFGSSAALSADGNVLTIGAYSEGSHAIGLEGDQQDNSLSSAGAVYVFTRDAAGIWIQRSYAKASNTRSAGYFGNAVTLSADGETLAVGSYVESSASTGVGGDQQSASAPGAGAVYVY